MLTNKILGTFLVLFISINSISQELNCQINIQKPRIQGGSEQLFRDMQKDIFEFVNQTRWTNHNYSNEERIDCSIQIKISGYQGSKFIGTIQVISNRPVYGTSLQSPMLNYKEDDNLFEFEYIQNQGLEFNESRHVSNLTSVLAFYAYIIIGLDYDSFSMQGGTEYFQKAQRIVNNAQSSNDKGWKAFESVKQNNRYYLIENLLNAKYGIVRRANYRYHRLGMDVMQDKFENGRTEVTESLKFIQRAYRQKPNLFIIKLFFDAKHKEIINIFAEANPPEKNRVFNIVRQIDPAHLKQYDKLKTN